MNQQPNPQNYPFSQSFSAPYLQISAQCPSLNTKIDNSYIYDLPSLNTKTKIDKKDYILKDGDEEIDPNKIIIDIKNIFKSSTFTLHLNNIQNLSDLVVYRNNLLNEEKINYNEFKNILEKVQIKSIEYNEINNIIDNYFQLIKFIKYIKERINEKIKNIELEIELKIKENEAENKNNSLKYKNIICEYIIVKPLIMNMKSNSYYDCNILSNQNYDNFKIFLSDLCKNIIL